MIRDTRETIELLQRDTATENHARLKHLSGLPTPTRVGECRSTQGMIKRSLLACVPRRCLKTCLTRSHDRAFRLWPESTRVDLHRLTSTRTQTLWPTAHILAASDSFTCQRAAINIRRQHCCRQPLLPANRYGHFRYHNRLVRPSQTFPLVGSQIVQSLIWLSTG